MHAFRSSPSSPPDPKRTTPSPKAAPAPAIEDLSDSDIAYERIVELRRSFDKGLISRERFDELKDQVLWPDGQPGL